MFHSPEILSYQPQAKKKVFLFQEIFEKYPFVSFEKDIKRRRLEVVKEDNKRRRLEVVKEDINKKSI